MSAGTVAAVRSLEHDVGKARVLLLGSVRGLVREARDVSVALNEFAPDAIALPVGPRELQEIEETLKDKGKLGDRPKAKGKKAARPTTGPSGLRDKALPPDEDDSAYEDFGLFVSSSDMVFMRKLSKFGDVEMPPPSYQEAVRQAHAKKLPALGVDLDDEAYTEVFVKHVSLFALMRQGRRMSRLANKRIKGDDPEAFAMEWDRLETKVGGYLRVQKAREEKIAAGIAALCKDHGRVLAIVEVERMDGVVESLRTISAAAGFGPTAEASPKGESPSRA